MDQKKPFSFISFPVSGIFFLQQNADYDSMATPHLVIHSAADGHFGLLPLLAILNNAT
jgi:hypothetical protein